MKTCDKCRYAEWRKTRNGRLHPSGDGRCAFPWKLPPLPVAMYFLGGDPKPCGGHIFRGTENPGHCPCWDSVRIQKGFYYSGRIQADMVRGLDMIEKAMGTKDEAGP